MHPENFNGRAFRKGLSLLRHRIGTTVILFSLAGLTSHCGKSPTPKGPDYHLVKFDTLDRLCRPIQLPGGEQVYYLHYQMRRQRDLVGPGKYGIGTVDDAARGLLVYLRWHE
ncbi:MAG: hypothetical protein D6814_17600, partial [Calditrichaeota bacterium]